MWCKEHGIRLSGVPLGRPLKNPEKNRARRRKIREDEGIRNAVEGKFSQAKRRYGPNRGMARLAESSQTVVSMIFLVMTLDRLLSGSFLPFIERLFPELEVWQQADIFRRCQASLYHELTVS